MTTPAQRRAARAPVAVLLLGGALAVGLVFLGAALASTPPPAPDAAQTPGTAGAARPVNVIMRDYRFDPTPLYLYPDETVELTVFNAGLVEHELVLGDAAVQLAWAEADARATPPAPFATPPQASVSPDVGGLRVLLPSGGSTTVRYTVPGAGTLLVVCNLPGHAENGMVGRVQFVER
jgi:uncharacterized cupredoxin-like copper-binding protein